MSNDDKDAVPEMTVQELKRLRESGRPYTLLDVREPFERDIAVIEGAEHIPLGQLGDRMEELPRDKKLVVHCKTGGRSAKAVGLLRDAGFEDVWNVTGGINAWSKEIDPSVALY